MAGNTAGSRRVLVGADAGTGRTVAGPFGQDHVRPCAGCVAGYGRVDRACHCQHRTACVEASFGGRIGAGHCGAGRSVCRVMPDHRFYLGASDMGHLVGMGWPVDLDADPVLPLSRLYRARQCIERKGSVSRTAAVFGIIGAVNIPIINRSVVWWESQHQKASITLGGSSIDSAYLWPLFASALGFTLIFGAVVLMRMRAQLAEIRIEARMRRMAED